MEENKKSLKPYHGLIGLAAVFLMLEFLSPLLYKLFGNYYTMFGELLIPLIALVIIIIARADVKESVPFKLPPIKIFFASVGLQIGTTMLSGAINVMTSRLIPNYSARGDAINEMVTSMSPMLAIVSVALLPAVCEELFCRGFIQSSLKCIKQKWLVILLVALAFGVLHRDLYAFIPTMLMGALFAFITLETESLLIPMILHFTNNAISVISAYSLAGASEEAGDILTTMPIGMSVGYMLLYLGIALFFLIFCGSVFMKKKLSGKKIVVTVVASALLAGGGLMTTSVSMFDFSSMINKNATYDYSDGPTENIEFELEGGTYIISVTSVSKDDCIISLELEGESIAESSASKTAILSATAELEKGKYKITLLDADGKPKANGSAEVAVMIIKSHI